jgi:hypothetical protein
MRIPAFSLLVFWLLIDASFSQTTDIGSLKTVNSPIYQPVLLGTGPDALINRIDTQELIKKGQKDAVIMFACRVNKKGEATWSGTYLGSPESKLIEQELQKRLADTRFVPGIYNRLPVDAIYYGTLTFNIVNDKPRLRIFSNQETEEIRKESNFVGPQPFFGNDSKFTGLHYPIENTPVMVTGVATLELKVDASGNLQAIKLHGEEPPLLGFGGAAVTDFRNAKFIPAFRDGKPVACEITLPVFYKPSS